MENLSIGSFLSGLAGLLTAAGVIIIAVLAHKKKMAEMELGENTMLRKQLWDQLERSRAEIERSTQISLSLHAKIDRISMDLDSWKNRYYLLQETHNKAMFDLRTELQNKFAQIPPPSPSS